MDSRIATDIKKLNDALSAGEFILDRYKVLDRPKIGGESVVLKVKYRDLDSVKALKLIPVYPDGPNTAAAVTRQIHIWQRFQSLNENILRIEDVHTDEVLGVPVVAFRMEYSDIGSLHDVIYNDDLYERVDIASFFRIANGIVSGFMATSLREHSGLTGTDLLLHGDIKPQNVIMVENDFTMVPRIIDFGISVASHERGKGLSLPYAAPERLDGTAQSPTMESELYSLGVTLYEFLYGQLPVNLSLDASDDQEARRTLLHSIRMAKIQYAHPRLSLLPHHVQEFNDLVANLLQPEPRDRTLSVSHIHEKLEELETDARTQAGKTRSTSYPGRDRYFWNPAVHHEFREQEYLFLVRSSHASTDSQHNVAALLSEKRIDSFSLDDVFGQYDHIVSFWSKRPFREFNELAEVKNAHFLDGSILQLGQTRNLKGKLPRLQPLLPIERRRQIKQLVETNNLKELKRLGYVTGAAVVGPKDIRVFTLIEMTGAKNKLGGDTLYEAIYDLFNVEQASKLITDGRICHVVEASEAQQETRFVLEFAVARYERVFQIIDKVTRRCRKLDCSFHTYLGVSHKPVRLSDDGEFLSGIMHA